MHVYEIVDSEFFIHRSQQKSPKALQSRFQQKQTYHYSHLPIEKLGGKLFVFIIQASQ